MKIFRLFAVLAASLASAAHAATLPASCGSDKIKFFVTSFPAKSPPPPPAAGKAQIIFFQTNVTHGATGAIFGGPDYETRFGLDGAWVAVTSNNSWFALDITPGDHHLCMAVQEDSKPAKDKTAVALFTAEPGKTYFFQFKVVMRTEPNNNIEASMFSQIDPAEAQALLKTGQLAQFALLPQ
jgi:hypothetical protein